MSAKAAKKKKKVPSPDQANTGLWVDAALLSRLHGRKSSPLALPPAMGAEAQRLLHYADVALGIEKKETFVSAKPTKKRDNT
jgi:hypothetical protein